MSHGKSTSAADQAETSKDKFKFPVVSPEALETLTTEKTNENVTQPVPWHARCLFFPSPAAKAESSAVVLTPWLPSSAGLEHPQLLPE